MRKLLDWLEGEGVRRSGDLVELVPSKCETREIEPSARTMVVTISTRARDRAGDIIEPGGARLEHYRKNPVVLWAHDYREQPLAKSEWIKLVGDSIIAKPRFHDSTDLAREVYSLYAEGYLNAWSIGFIPEEWEPEGKGYRVKQWDLLEYSAVPIPANPEALTMALKENRITAPILCKAIGAALPDLVQQDIGAPEDRGAIRYAETPKAEESAAWDAGAEVAAADVEDLKAMCAWVGEDPEKKESYKLPHHRAPAPHPVVWNGVKAAGAAIQGARGGVEIPAEDVDGVRSHIAHHYRDFDRVAPWEEQKEAAQPPQAEPEIPAELTGGIAQIVRDEVRREIRRLKGKLD